MFNKKITFGNQSGPPRLGEAGQTLLIIVLVMVVALTAGLSIVSRTLTNLRTTTEQANSQKALSAAEAGIEQSLKNFQTGANPNLGTLSFGPNTTYTTTLTSVNGATPFLLNGGSQLDKDDGAYVWVIPYSQNFDAPYWNGTLTFYWGSSSEVCSPTPSINTKAALEIIVLSGSKNSPSIKKYAFDPCSRGNNFTSPNGSSTPIGGKTFIHQTPANGANSIAITNGLLVRVVPLYASTFVGVQGAPALPSQGSIVSSSGTSDTTKRKLEVFQGYPEIPVELFPYGLFQPTNE